MKNTTARSGLAAVLRALALTHGAAAAPAAASQDPFERVPLTHWAFDEVWRVAARGFPVAEFQRRFYWKHYSRFEFAVMVRAVVLDGLRELREPESAALGRLGAREIAGLERLTEGFASEFEALGTAVEPVRHELAAARSRRDQAARTGARLLLPPASGPDAPNACSVANPVQSRALWALARTVNVDATGTPLRFRSSDPPLRLPDLITAWQQSLEAER
ncbi:MAG: hypothetical protein K0Q72_3866 [Armatimonadetes bacterium]|jgi:hypothetical protein|nr:hypothetical protein [Armatimonadota bacterium]